MRRHVSSRRAAHSSPTATWCGWSRRRRPRRPPRRRPTRPRMRRAAAQPPRQSDRERHTMTFNVSAWCIRNPIPSVLLFIMLTLVGLMSFNTMKIQQFPDIDLPTVIVSASLPGASPSQLETEVARKIENSVATVQGVKHIYTTVQDGTATITVEFRLGKPTQQAVDDVRDAVSRVRSDLPGD